MSPDTRKHNVVWQVNADVELRLQRFHMREESKVRPSHLNPKAFTLYPEP